jgi:hypothetical protein
MTETYIMPLPMRKLDTHSQQVEEQKERDEGVKAIEIEQEVRRWKT